MIPKEIYAGTIADVWDTPTPGGYKFKDLFFTRWGVSSAFDIYALEMCLIYEWGFTITAVKDKDKTTVVLGKITGPGTCVAHKGECSKENYNTIVFPLTILHRPSVVGNERYGTALLRALWRYCEGEKEWPYAINSKEPQGSDNQGIKGDSEETKSKP